MRRNRATHAVRSLHGRPAGRPGATRRRVGRCVARSRARARGKARQLARRGRVVRAAARRAMRDRRRRRGDLGASRPRTPGPTRGMPAGALRPSCRPSPRRARGPPPSPRGGHLAARARPGRAPAKRGRGLPAFAEPPHGGGTRRPGAPRRRRAHHRSDPRRGGQPARGSRPARSSRGAVGRGLAPGRSPEMRRRRCRVLRCASRNCRNERGFLAHAAGPPCRYVGTTSDGKAASGLDRAAPALAPLHDSL